RRGRNRAVRAYHPGVAPDTDAKPPIEDLEAEHARLKQLERRLVAERERVRAETALELADLKEALREAANRAALRERELAAVQERFERRLEGPERLAGARARLVERQVRRDERREAELEAEAIRSRERFAESKRLAEEAERRVAGVAPREGALEAREQAATARESELAARLAELEAREAALAEPRDDP